MLILVDARHIPLIDGCVQCVVTSPPYWGLRDYGFTGQIGLEATPDAYVASLVDVFREVRRVLKDDGTVWLILGDSYANTGMTDTSKVGGFTGDRIRAGVKGTMDSRPREIPAGLKQKDLVGIPWRVAFALQADGWWLRSDIIWHKPNPMPESVTDRPTKAHEYIFLLTKSSSYYYDAAAIAEKSTRDWSMAGGSILNRTGRLGASGRNEDSGPSKHYTSQDATTKNKRTVWTIPTVPYSGAHFATFPEKLVEPCILAGCPVGGLVYDPFIGSGTVGAVAERLSRRWVGTDLSYQNLAQERTVQRGIRW